MKNILYSYSKLTLRRVKIILLYNKFVTDFRIESLFVRMLEKIKPIIFYIIFFLFILAFCTTANEYDVDFWARLVSGMSVFQTGHVLTHDFLSYTPTHIYFDHEWGSGVVFYIVQHFFSSAGILFLQAILIFLIFFVASQAVNLRGVKTTSAYNFLFYYFAFSAVSQTMNEPVRCQLFSFLFFAIFLYVLEKTRKSQSNLIFSLPFLMVIWNNMHAGCVSGIGLIIMYIIGEFFNKKPAKKYVYALIPTVLVLPINPWGFSYLKFLLIATTMPRPDIIEWWGLFYPENLHRFMKFKIFASVLLFTEAGIVLSQIKSKAFNFDKTKFIVLFVTLFLGIEHVKLLPFFVITSTIFLYDDFYSGFNYLTKDFFNKHFVVKESIVYFFMLIFAISNINSKAFTPIVNFDRYPIRAVEFIKINSIKGNLFVNFGYGSYVSYKLYPDNKIFMDGRFETVYPDYIETVFRNFYLGLSGWEYLLNKYPPEVMIIEKNYPIYTLLKKNNQWKSVFEDKLFAVFVKSIAINKKYETPSLDLEYYRKSLFETNINFK